MQFRAEERFGLYDGRSMKRYVVMVGLGVFCAGCKKEGTAAESLTDAASPSASTNATSSAETPPTAAVDAKPPVASAVKNKNAEWLTFVGAHPETKGLMNLLTGAYSDKKIFGFGRANVPPMSDDALKAFEGKPAYVLLAEVDSGESSATTPTWFPPEDAQYTWSGSLVSRGEAKPRKATVRWIEGRGSINPRHLILVETPDKLAQGAYWFDGATAAGSPHLVRAIESKDKTVAIVVAYVGNGDGLEENDQVLLAFVGGRFQPILNLPKKLHRPDVHRSCKDVSALPEQVKDTCVWVQPLPEITSVEPLQITMWNDTKEGCADGNFRECSFVKQRYGFEGDKPMLVSVGEGTTVKRPLQAISRR